MADSYMGYPEAEGKVVEHVRYYNDPSSAPEVHIRFTDGTALSLKLSSALKLEAELYRIQEGDIQTLKRYPDV